MSIVALRHQCCLRFRSLSGAKQVNVPRTPLPGRAYPLRSDEATDRWRTSRSEAGRNACRGRSCDLDDNLWIARVIRPCGGCARVNVLNCGLARQVGEICGPGARERPVSKTRCLVVASTAYGA